jgi:arylsulfatase A-like enzyme
MFGLLTNRLVLVGVVSAIWIGWVLAPVAAVAADRPPNIVLFLIDDMGVMDTSVPFMTDAKGAPVRHPLNDFYRTPQMERLARQGIRFNQFSAMSVCSPTRLAIMTGQNAARHRTTNWINPDQNNAGPAGPPDWNWEGLKPGDLTLAALMRQAGYRTIHVGKGHFSPRHLPGADPSTLGFDVNIGGASIGAPGSYFANQRFGLDSRPDHAVPGLDKYRGTELFLTEALTLAACEQISSAVSESKPFFLYFPHYAVHAPFQADPRFVGNYEASGKRPGARAFASLVEGMDKSLGDVLDHLDRLGIADQTLILFVGDNGSDAPLGHEHAIACAAPLRGKKGSHYEGGTRVPFIAAWGKPDANRPAQQRMPIAAGVIQPQMANVCDLFPTVLQAAGIEPPAGHPVDGKPLTRLLAGGPDPEHSDEFLVHYPHAPHRSDYWTSYRKGDWKVVYHYLPEVPSAHGKRYQLFDLKNDPSESDDKAPLDPDRLRQMMSGLVAKLDEYGALYPVDPKTKTSLEPQAP